MALVWSVSLFLFYRKIFFELFKTESQYNNRLIPLWVILGITVIFNLIPSQMIINRLNRIGLFNDTADSYKDLLTTFQSDYERQNPTSKIKGKLRKYRQLL